MGTYATTTTLDLMAIGTTFDTATTSLAGQCITWAEEEVNKYVSKRYDISSFSTTVPPIIRSITEQLSLGYLYEQLSRGGKESLNRADRLIGRAMDNLKSIAAAQTSIADTSGALVVTRSTLGVVSNTSNYTPTFGEDDPLNWHVDPDKLDDIAQDRN